MSLKPSNKSNRCLVCGSHLTERAHIKTRGSGGGNEDWNIMYLCRRHHIEQHAIGIATFAMKYDSVMEYLTKNGWEIETIAGCRNPIYRLVRARSYK
jgi:hypothetical protein